MQEKKSFIVRLEMMEQLDLLTMEQRGEIFTAMCCYALDGSVPEFDDPMLKMMFSFVRSQIDRDTERYEKICLKNAENGRKGGRPKKTERFSDETQKTERFFKKPTKSLRDSDSDSDPDREPDPDPVCERDRDRDARAQNSTAHTPRQKMLTVQDVLSLAGNFGFTWTEQEAQDFLAYNIDKGRTDGWGYAVKCWEKNRPKYSGSHKKPIDQAELDELNDYLSLSNRFKEDEDNGGAV